MQAAARLPKSEDRDLIQSIPLYLASLVVTLAGVGAVGVTIAATSWTPVWATLAVVGHLVSFGLRRSRVPWEYVFYPVMLVTLAAILMEISGRSVLPGLEHTLGQMDLGMVTAVLVGTIAVARSFTLLNNGTLLFSPVPAITMLALVGSTNPNAEVPVFFGLLLLGSLFISGFESHLRRSARIGRPAGAVLPHLLTCWALAIAVVVGAMLFPIAVQPLVGPLSPLMGAVSRLRSLTSFAQPNNTVAPVGAGPIQLSPNPVYEAFMPEGGRLRTAVYTAYTGTDWRAERNLSPWMVPSARKVETQLPATDLPYTSRLLSEFELGPDPEVRKPVRTHRVLQQFVTRGYPSSGVPSLGRVSTLRYPASSVALYPNGTVTGNSHGSPGRFFAVESVVTEPTPEQLRSAEAIQPSDFEEPENLALPIGTARVQDLAKRITAGKSNNYDRIRAILDHIEQNCQYSLLEDVTPAGSDAADHYLFTSKRGACDLAATAAAVMCRGIGIPARVAVGYVADEPLPSGDGFLIRQQHAHMWIEAYFAGYGWVPFDAAPPMASIHEPPLSIALHTLAALLGKIGGGGLDAVLVLLLALVTAGMLVGRWALSLARRPRVARCAGAAPGDAAGQVAMAYRQALERLARRGWSRHASQTPREFLEATRREWAGSQDAALGALATLTACLERSVFGGDGSEDAIREARSAAADLVRRVQPRAKPPRSARQPISVAQTPGAA